MKLLQVKKRKMLTRVASLALILGFTLAGSLGAQTSQATKEQKGSEAATSSEPDDSLGRSTPRSAVIAFLKTIQKENFERSAEYLDSKLKPAEREELPLKLGVVLDRQLSTPLSSVSDSRRGISKTTRGPTGTCWASFPASREMCTFSWTAYSVGKIARFGCSLLRAWRRFP